MAGRRTGTRRWLGVLGGLPNWLHTYTMAGGGATCRLLRNWHAGKTCLPTCAGPADSNCCCQILFGAVHVAMQTLGTCSNGAGRHRAAAACCWPARQLARRRTPNLFFCSAVFGTTDHAVERTTVPTGTSPGTAGAGDLAFFLGGRKPSSAACRCCCVNDYRCWNNMNRQAGGTLNRRPATDHHSVLLEFLGPFCLSSFASSSSAVALVAPGAWGRAGVARRTWAWARYRRVHGTKQRALFQQMFLRRWGAATSLFFYAIMVMACGRVSFVSARR